MAIRFWQIQFWGSFDSCSGSACSPRSSGKEPLCWTMTAEFVLKWISLKLCLLLKTLTFNFILLIWAALRKGEGFSRFNPIWIGCQVPLLFLNKLNRSFVKLGRFFNQSCLLFHSLKFEQQKKMQFRLFVCLIKSRLL